MSRYQTVLRNISALSSIDKVASVRVCNLHNGRLVTARASCHAKTCMRYEYHNATNMIQTGDSGPQIISATKRAILRLHGYDLHPQDASRPSCPPWSPNSTPSETTVRRLMADLEAIPDHRGRVYPLSSLLVIHMLAGGGDGNGSEDTAACARGTCPR